MSGIPVCSGPDPGRGRRSVGASGGFLRGSGREEWRPVGGGGKGLPTHRNRRTDPRSRKEKKEKGGVTSTVTPPLLSPD